MCFPLRAEEFLCRNDVQVAAGTINKASQCVINIFLSDLELLGKKIVNYIIRQHYYNYGVVDF